MHGVTAPMHETHAADQRPMHATHAADQGPMNETHAWVRPSTAHAPVPGPRASHLGTVLRACMHGHAHAAVPGPIASHLGQYFSTSPGMLPVNDGEVLGRERFDSLQPDVIPQAGVRDGIDADVRVADAASAVGCGGLQRPLDRHSQRISRCVLFDASDGPLQQPGGIDICRRRSAAFSTGMRKQFNLGQSRAARNTLEQSKTIPQHSWAEHCINS